MTTIGALCDDLVKAYAGRRLDVGPNLRPGLSGEAYARTLEVPIERLPADLLALYAWRDGCDEDADAQLLFRDNCFVSAARAVQEWTRARPYLGSDVLGFESGDAIPIAVYEGALYVVPFGPHAFGDALPHPVVSIYRRVEPYFDSVETMLKTCADWVRHPSWDPEDGVEDEAEQTIWQRHNPRLAPAV